MANGISSGDVITKQKRSELLDDPSVTSVVTTPTEDDDKVEVTSINFREPDEAPTRTEQEEEARQREIRTGDPRSVTEPEQLDVQPGAGPDTQEQVQSQIRSVEQQLGQVRDLEAGREVQIGGQTLSQQEAEQALIQRRQELEQLEDAVTDQRTSARVEDAPITEGGLDVRTIAEVPAAETEPLDPETREQSFETVRTLPDQFRESTRTITDPGEIPEQEQITGEPDTAEQQAIQRQLERVERFEQGGFTTRERQAAQIGQRQIQEAEQIDALREQQQQLQSTRRELNQLPGDRTVQVGGEQVSVQEARQQVSDQLEQVEQRLQTRQEQRDISQQQIQAVEDVDELGGVTAEGRAIQADVPRRIPFVVGSEKLEEEAIEGAEQAVESFIGEETPGAQTAGDIAGGAAGAVSGVIPETGEFIEQTAQFAGETAEMVFEETPQSFSIVDVVPEDRRETAQDVAGSIAEGATRGVVGAATFPITVPAAGVGVLGGVSEPISNININQGDIRPTETITEGAETVVEGGRDVVRSASQQLQQLEKEDLEQLQTIEREDIEETISGIDPSLSDFDDEFLAAGAAAPTIAARGIQRDFQDDPIATTSEFGVFFLGPAVRGARSGVRRGARRLRERGSLLRQLDEQRRAREQANLAEERLALQEDVARVRDINQRERQRLQAERVEAERIQTEVRQELTGETRQRPDQDVPPADELFDSEPRARQEQRVRDRDRVSDVDESLTLPEQDAGSQVIQRRSQALSPEERARLQAERAEAELLQLRSRERELQRQAEQLPGVTEAFGTRRRTQTTPIGARVDDVPQVETEATTPVEFVSPVETRQAEERVEVTDEQVVEGLGLEREQVTDVSPVREQVTDTVDATVTAQRQPLERARPLQRGRVRQTKERQRTRTPFELPDTEFEPEPGIDTEGSDVGQRGTAVQPSLGAVFTGREQQVGEIQDEFTGLEQRPIPIEGETGDTGDDSDDLEQELTGLF